MENDLLSRVFAHLWLDHFDGDGWSDGVLSFVIGVGVWALEDNFQYVAKIQTWREKVFFACWSYVFQVLIDLLLCYQVYYPHVILLARQPEHLNC